MPAPTALPTVTPTPTMLEAAPRCDGANRSGTMACAAARTALTPT